MNTISQAFTGLLFLFPWVEGFLFPILLPEPLVSGEQLFLFLTRDSFWPTVFLTTWYPLHFLTQVFGCYLHGRIPFLRPAPAYRVVVLDFLKLYLIIVCLRPSFSWTRWFYLVLGLGPSSLGNSHPFTEEGGWGGGGERSSLRSPNSIRAR